MPQKYSTERSIISNILSHNRNDSQEEEDKALFSTLQDISRQVHREAGRCVPLTDDQDYWHLKFGARPGPQQRLAEVLSRISELMDRITGILLMRRTPFYSDDEEEALFSTIKEISYQVHKEAAASGLTREKYESFFPAAAELISYEPAESPQSSPGILVRLARLVDRVLNILLMRKHYFQLDEEEEALFSTMQEISDTVHREAAESGLLQHIDLANPLIWQRAKEEKPLKDALFRRNKDTAIATGSNMPKKQSRSRMDTYMDAMDDDLFFTTRIIERNRAVSLRHISAGSDY